MVNVYKAASLVVATACLAGFVYVAWLGGPVLAGILLAVGWVHDVVRTWSPRSVDSELLLATLFGGLMADPTTPDEVVEGSGFILGWHIYWAWRAPRADSSLAFGDFRTILDPSLQEQEGQEPATGDRGRFLDRL